QQRASQGIEQGLATEPQIRHRGSSDEGPGTCRARSKLNAQQGCVRELGEAPTAAADMTRERGPDDLVRHDEDRLHWRVWRHKPPLPIALVPGVFTRLSIERGWQTGARCQPEPF